MTIMETKGKYWIEIIEFPTFTTSTSEEFLQSATKNLERPGIVVGWSQNIRTIGGLPNAASVGTTILLDQGGTTLTIGATITGLQFRIYKAASAAGNATNVGMAILYMRKTGG